MAYEPSVNKCFAFSKKPDAHPKAPDFKGTIKITEPGVYDIALWKGEVGKETKYKGLSIKLTTAISKQAPVQSQVSQSVPPALDESGNPLPF